MAHPLFDHNAYRDRGAHVSGARGPTGVSGATGPRGFAGSVLVAAAPAGGHTYDAMTLTSGGEGGAG